MFRLLGKLVSRGWPFLLFAWLVVAVLMWVYLPDVNKVTDDGPGLNLPKGYESCNAQDLLSEGFGEEQSRLIVLFQSDAPLTPEDRDIIKSVMTPVTAPTYRSHSEDAAIVGYVVSHWTHDYLTRRLTSTDGRVITCAIALKKGFVDLATRRYVNAVGEHLDRELVAKHPHLSWDITDSAAIGRDYDRAAETSLGRTQLVTVTLVITILLLLYRSPVTWVVPLATIALSLFVANGVIAFLSSEPHMAVFGLQKLSIPKLVPIYLVVIIFGSGTDYCLFLIGRFREEMAQGHTRFEAAQIAIANVGGAMTASALTTIAGLCMMFFADFDIFRTTGPALGIGLAVALVAAITFAPCLMVVLGKRLFWPRHLRVVDTEDTRSGRIWASLARTVLKHPGLVMVVVVLWFLPFWVTGLIITPSYDLFSELPDSSPSVRGHKLIVDRFDRESRAEQLSLVLKSRETVDAHGKSVKPVTFTGIEQLRAIDQLRKDLERAPGVIEARCVTNPIGHTKDADNNTGNREFARYLDAHRAFRKYLAGTLGPLDLKEYGKAMVFLSMAKERYVSPDARITRINLLLEDDMFSRDAMRMVGTLKPVVTSSLERSELGSTVFHFAGVSSHMNDLGIVTRADLSRLRWMVLGVLFIILAVMLRELIAPVYLLATMVINYFAALGITHLIFVNIAGWFGAGHAGLDWKVEFFLFVLLVAIGVDYNIYIMSRLREEKRRGPFRQGLHRAIVSTGSIISSCGVIMAGTFGSLLATPLSIMMQIGCAMAIGVLMDTFIVRPLVVPALALTVEGIKTRLRRAEPPESAS